jgi:hypothetical protein
VDFRELFHIQHARAHALEVGGADFSVQDVLLRGVTEEQMRRRPAPGFNSLAWLLWHITRAEDIGINVIIMEQPQVLDEGDWAARLNIPRRDLGSGMTDEEVDDFVVRVNVAELLAYRAAVGRRTQEAIRSISPDVLDEEIDEAVIMRARGTGAFGPHAEWAPQRWQGKKKAFTLGNTVLAHTFLHLGQGDDIRSLLGLPNY